MLQLIEISQKSLENYYEECDIYKYYKEKAPTFFLALYMFSWG
jgi:hypothetical protein